MTTREVINQCKAANLLLGTQPDSYLAYLLGLGLIVASANGLGYADDTVARIRRIRGAQRVDKIPLQYMKAYLEKEDGA